MAKKSRRIHSPVLKAKVAVEAIRGKKTAPEIASQFGIHPTRVSTWKRVALNGLPGLFACGGGTPSNVQDALVGELYQEIGKLKVELDWFKKKSGDLY